VYQLPAKSEYLVWAEARVWQQRLEEFYENGLTLALVGSDLNEGKLSRVRI